MGSFDHRRTRAIAAAITALFALSLLALPSVQGADAAVRPGGLRSQNVRWVANIPIDSPGVGSRIVPVGDKLRFYVTGAKGLTIYDVTRPARPRVLGHLPLPHFENEDVSVSKDGRWVVIAHDADFQFALSQDQVFTYVIDARNPRLPRLASAIPMGTHIATCADDDCDYLYGSDGWTFDLRDKTRPKEVVPGWKSVLASQGVGWRDTTHDLNRDDAGYIITDSSPRVMFDPRPDPANPVLLTQGPVTREKGDLAYQHNNLRLRADEWQPYQPNEDGTDRPLQPGELMVSTGETSLNPQCEDSGPLATWSVRDWDKGAPMQVLDVYRPQSGIYVNGDPAFGVLGCSSHWFDWRDGVLAAGWYESGTRFFDIDQGTGKITEIGFFQPVFNSVSSAHWVNDEYVYTVDYARGIDILRFDRDGPRPSAAEVSASWDQAAKRVTGPLAKASPSAGERWRCRLAQRS